MKTMTLLLIFASGLIWPAYVHEAQNGGKTVISKQMPVAKPRVVEWSI